LGLAPRTGSQGEGFTSNKKTPSRPCSWASTELLEKAGGNWRRKFAARAHAELTEWINQHPEEAKKMVNAELKELTKREKCRPN